MTAGPATLVIFGASGDLAHRKLIPALYSLYVKQRLPQDLTIVGFAIDDFDDEGIRRSYREWIEAHGGGVDEQRWREFAGRIRYLRSGFEEDAGYGELKSILDQAGPGGCLCYLAVPPRFIVEVIRRLGESGITREDGGWRRVVVEKPFGHDLESARRLNRDIHAVLREDQIYRIDHYVAKETVQNLLVLRFANTIFEPLWNRNYVDHVQITLAEEVGVEHRGAFYDRVGVIRDIFQNHLMQLMAVVAMEPPAALEADALHNEKVKLLAAVRVMEPGEVERYALRGRYRGFREEPGVAPDSETATFAALKLYIDNWRWDGVPFYLRSGKKLARKVTEILVQFKRPPHLVFPGAGGFRARSNLLALCLQPDEGVHLRFEAKVPDTVAEMRPVDMEFRYAESFGESAIPDAYERLLLDAVAGDRSLFVRNDGIEIGWRLMDPVIEGFRLDAERRPCPVYEPGTWGPAEADELLGRDRRRWLYGCGERAGEACDTASHEAAAGQDQL